MADAIPCSIADCERPKQKRGWCRAHYLRWYRYGDPLGGRGSVTPTTLPTCSVDGCDRTNDSQGLCSAHYQRAGRTGDPGTAPIEPRRPGAVCSIDGCSRPHYGKDLCTKHWQRLYKNGDPNIVLLGSWKGDDVGYKAVHERLNRYRGRAKTFPCAHCGKQAKDWAYDHADPNEKRAQHVDGYFLAYSTDPDRYMPLCKACHSRFDDNIPRRPTG